MVRKVKTPFPMLNFYFDKYFRTSKKGAELKRYMRQVRNRTIRRAKRYARTQTKRLYPKCVTWPQRPGIEFDRVKKVTYRRGLWLDEAHDMRKEKIIYRRRRLKY